MTRPSTPRLLRGLDVRIRDLAERLLDDPIAAHDVARKALRGLAGEDASTLVHRRMIERQITEHVVSLCRRRSGNARVADWREYRIEHRKELEAEHGKDPKWIRSVRPIARAAVPLHEAPKAHPVPPTRRAREALRVVRQEANASSGGSASVERGVAPAPNR